MLFVTGLWRFGYRSKRRPLETERNLATLAEGAGGFAALGELHLGVEQVAQLQAYRPVIAEALFEGEVELPERLFAHVGKTIDADLHAALAGGVEQQIGRAAGRE